MRILTKNNNKLYLKCQKVDYNNGYKIAKNLHITALLNRDCIGLAHNQIGGNKAVFVAKINNTWKYFINPIIISKSNNNYMHTEFCMSFPNKPSKVLRSETITIQYDVENGIKTEKFEGFNSCIIQHELNHLEGKTIFCKNK